MLFELCKLLAVRSGLHGKWEAALGLLHRISTMGGTVRREVLHLLMMFIHQFSAPLVKSCQNTRFLNICIMPFSKTESNQLCKFSFLLQPAKNWPPETQQWFSSTFSLHTDWVLPVKQHLQKAPSQSLEIRVSRKPEGEQRSGREAEAGDSQEQRGKKRGSKIKAELETEMLSEFVYATSVYDTNRKSQTRCQVVRRVRQFDQNFHTTYVKYMFARGVHYVTSLTWQQNKKPLTTLALLNHVHRLAGLEADLWVLLPLVVGHGHILLQHHGLRAVDPWGEQTGRQPPAGRGTTRTTPAADYTAAPMHPVHRHRSTPAPCHLDQSQHKLATWLHRPTHLAIQLSRPPARSKGLRRIGRNQNKRREGGRKCLLGMHITYCGPMTWTKMKEAARGERKWRKKEEPVAVGGEVWGANDWKNGEVSLWKINSAVERKGLPSTDFGSQSLDSKSGRGAASTPIMAASSAGLK